MIKNKSYTDKEWKELASVLSEEKEAMEDLHQQFLSGDSDNISEKWKKLHGMNEREEINVDKAWETVSARLKTEEKQIYMPARSGILKGTLLRVAAAALILISLGAGFLYLNNKGVLTGKTVIATDNNQINLLVKLPDGSNVYLNRNTRLSYRPGSGRSERTVTLSGEAFFEILPDPSNPFTVDAGNARVEVLGTSFNVITKNNNSEVEVFVKTGQVMIAGSSGSPGLVIDPGFVGIMDSKVSDKRLNNNPNYMSWNTGRLTYERQKLEVVFRDLKKLYNINIITSDKEILDFPIDASFNNEPHETIIRIICTTFNLNYRKDGDIYHLGKK